jgi:8-oxo-dGTP diphosphatase
VLGPYLGNRRYEVAGAPKRVRYWRATVAEIEHREPDDEVDEVRWLRRKDARALLTYDDDRVLVTQALALPNTSATIVLRHAEATKRAAWRASGDPQSDLDHARTLNHDGVVQAHALAEILDLYGLRSVVSSDARRCLSTVEPFANLRGLTVRIEHALSEEGCADDPDATQDAVRGLLADVEPTVWCTHRPVLPIALRAVAGELGVDQRDDRLDPRLRAGAAIVLHRVPGGAVAAIDRWES